MPQNYNQILWGEGVAYVAGVKLFEIQELIINFGLNVMEAPKGDGGGNIVIPTTQPISGRAGFLGLNSSNISSLTGGSSATGTKKRIRGEELSVSSNTVTCSQTPIENTLEVIRKGSGYQPLKRVSGSPAAADEYSISGTTITFYTGAFADATIMEVSYIYADAADGETLSFDPGDLPSSFELYGTLRTKELYTDTLADIVIYAAKCDRTGEITLGGAIGNISTHSFDFNIRIDSDGDFEIYFP